MYGKLFVQMYQGTLATKGPWQALVTFQQMVILADKHGSIDMTPDAISRITTIPLEIIETGLQELSKPDSESRSPAEDGRRIVPLADNRTWGWKVVNYEHYRKIRSEEERREYHRQYMRKRRSVNENVKVSTGAQQSQPIAVSSMQEAVSITTVTPGVPPSANGDWSIPLKGGFAWTLSPEFIAELERLCPRVDARITLREIRLWCLGNEDRLKTRRGVKKFITRWFGKEQEKANVKA